MHTKRVKTCDTDLPLSRAVNTQVMAKQTASGQTVNKPPRPDSSVEGIGACDTGLDVHRLRHKAQMPGSQGRKQSVSMAQPGKAGVSHAERRAEPSTSGVCGRSSYPGRLSGTGFPA